MAKKISSRDLFENEDIFKGIRDSAAKTLKSLDEMRTKLKASAEALKKTIGGIQFGNTKEINKLLSSLEKINKLSKEAQAIDQMRKTTLSAKSKAELELLTIEQQKQRVKQETLRTTKLEAQEEARLTKEREKAARAAQNEASYYKQLEKNTRELKNQSKELGAQMLSLEAKGKKNSQEYRKLAETYQKVTTAAQAGDVKLKQLDRTVGDNFRNVGNYTQVLDKLRLGLGQLGLAFGFQQVVGLATKSLVSFDEEAANIAKTVGVTTEEAQALSRELLKIDTRTSVENLQKIAVIGGQLGIGKTDIVGFTEAIDKLNVALGDEFTGGAEEITSVIGGLRNVLGDIKTASVSQDLLNIGNALNVLGAEGSATSPVISDFAGRIGGVGIPLGLTSSQVLGLSATLQELNVTAERGGTAVGNILKQMASDTAGFAEFVGMSQESFTNLVNTDLQGAFNKVIEASGKFKGNAVGLATALDNLKIDGQGASEVLLKLSTNQDLLAKRTTQAGDALAKTNSITDEFGKKNETLQAKIDKLKNAFDKYILGLDEAGNVTGSFGVILDFLSKNLGTIITLVTKAGTAWLIYQTYLKSVQAYQFIVSGGLKDVAQQMLAQIPGTRAYRLEQVQLERAQRATAASSQMAGNAVKGFGAAIKSIAWMALIAALVEVAVKWYDIASCAAEARRQKDLYNKANEYSDKKSSEIVEGEKKKVQEKIRLLDLEMRKRKANGESQAKLDQERANREKDIYAQSKKDYDNTITSLEFSIASSKRLREEQKKQQKQTNQIRMRGQGSADLNAGLITDLNTSLQKNEMLLDKLKKGRKEFNDALDEAQVKQLEANSSTEDYTVNIKNNTGAIKNNYKGMQDVNKELEDYVTYLERIEVYLSNQDELLYNINATRAQANIDDFQRQIDTEFAYQVKQLKETGTFQSTLLNELIQKRADAEVKFLEDKDKFEKDQIDKKYTYEANQRALSLAKERDDLIRQADETLAKNLETFKDDKKKQAEAQTKYDEAILKIKENYNIRYSQLDEEEEKRYADLQLEKKGVTEKTQQDIANVNRKRVEDVTKMEKDLTSDFLEKENKKREDDLKKIADREKSKQEFAKMTADWLVKQSERIVEQLDKEIAAAEQQADTLRKLAETGNINAQQSLAEQERLIAEANKRKEQEIKRQQRIRLAETVYTTYSQKVEAGSKNPLAETIRDTTLLQAFINSLPTYESGTEDTGKDGRGVDGKGGMLSVLHPHERVIPKNLNEKIGNMSNEQLAKIAQEYSARSAMRYQGQDSSLDFAILVSEMKDLKREIINKPVTSVELGKITQSAIQIVEKTQKGNSVIYNRYRVGK